MEANEELILYPNLFKRFLLFIPSVILAFAGYMMWQQGDFIGLLTFLLFAGANIVLLIEFLPNASYLKLTPRGFIIRTIYRDSFTAWSDVDIFGVGKVGQANNKMVVLQYSDKHTKLQIGKVIAKGLAGYEGALPDNYGMSHEALAQLLNDWKAKFSEESK